MPLVGTKRETTNLKGKKTTIELFEFANKSVLSKASLPGLVPSSSPHISLIIFVMLQDLVCFKVNKIQDFYSYYFIGWLCTALQGCADIP